MRITIEKIIYPGKSLTRENEKVALADEGLPGEIIEGVIVKEKKNYCDINTNFILKESPHRISPLCAHYKVCSPYQYINYPFQIKIKEDQLKEFLSSSLKIEPPYLAMHPSERIWGYRNKIHLHIIYKNGNACAAYHTPGAKNVFVLIDNCFLATESMNKLIAKLLELITKNQLTNISEIIVRENQKKNQLLLACTGDAKYLSKQRTKGKLYPLIQEFPLLGITCLDKKTKREHVLHGKNYIEETIAGKNFFYGAKSFFQINTPMLELLIKDMRQSMPLPAGKNIIDLYSGVGIFGIVFSQGACQITAVESEEKSVLFLEKNIKANNITNLRICRGTSQTWLPRILKDKTDILIVDPPRKGLDSSLCSNIIKNPIDSLAYISCNPSTLVRDLKILLSVYKLESIFAYDFFPHTPHIETMVILRAK